MLRNYLKIALRNLQRRAGYTAINVAGLAIGMAACLLIGLYMGDELSYDDFHREADKVYLMGSEHEFFGRSVATSYPLAPTLVARVPPVKEAVRTADRSRTRVRHAERGMENEQRVLLADPTFFQFFSFPLVQGAPADVLSAPDAAVVTESMARNFFGDTDPMGQTLEVILRDTTHTLTVRGIAADAPSNSTIQFDLVAPTQLLNARARAPDGWGAMMFRTYARLDQPLSPDTLAAQTKRAVGERVADLGREPGTYLAMPLPELYLSDLHRAEGFRGQRHYLYIFGSIALFILLIASINYVNLVTVQAQQRAREVGVRKALGAQRMQLAGQFLSESTLVSTAAFVLAIGTASLVLPVFNTSFGTELVLFDSANGPLLAGLSACVLAIGALAGGYPAIVLSRFQPVRVLRATTASGSGGGGWLRRGLVVVQFAISAALIVSSVVVYQQLDYVQTKNLGFQGDQVVVVALQREGLAADGATVRQQLLQHPSVEHVTLADAVPAHVGMRLGLETDDVAPEAKTEKGVFTWSPISADVSFVETLGLQLVAGHSFDRNRGADAEQGFLLNEAAVRDLGWTPEEAIGKAFNFGSGESSERGQVIGVVKNFHTASLREEIMPISISVSDESQVSWSSGRGWVAAKLAPEGMQAGMEHIRSTFETLAPDATLEYQFLDDTFDAMYRSEERLSTIFTAFAGIAILLACLGLFGLAAFAAERRTKEIGIRKVLGASLENIVGLLSKEFAVLVAVALCVGMPAAYWGMERWLTDFAYRTSIGPVTFVMTAFVALAIAGLTVSYHAIRAAHADPATALRSE